MSKSKYADPVVDALRKPFAELGLVITHRRDKASGEIQVSCYGKDGTYNKDGNSKVGLATHMAAQKLLEAAGGLTRGIRSDRVFEQARNIPSDQIKIVPSSRPGTSVSAANSSVLAS